ncbi:hypothetical protein JAAARDRAFT_201317, partial [Jaapia argillacea MUCL 33604]
MALFCPACPQKDVNLMEGWMEEARDMPWLYARQLNLDGNFKAEQTRRKYPEDDTPIAEGSGYLCSEAPYKEYLGLAKNTPQKATCHDHKAQSQANSATKHLAVTGIVAAACARHGCFCPGSCANLQFGERQVNMDYILAQALRLTKVPGVCPSIVLYDIICQYGVYVERRFGKLPQFLDIGGALDILKGIGLFHVHGHQDSCGPRFSPNYIVGAGQLLGIVALVIKKYRRACKQVPISATAFQEMDAIASSQQREAWIATYDKAMRTRQTNVEAMDVFAPSIKKAATKSELQQSLSRKEGGPGPIWGTASWLSNGIAIQEGQVELGAAVRKMGRRPTADDLNQIDDRRCHLNARIDTWQKSLEHFLVQDLMVPEAADPSGDDPMIISDGDAGLDVGEEYDNVFDPDEDGLWEDDYDYDAIQVQADQSNGPVDAEKRLIALPSTLGASQCRRRGLVKLLEQEIELRQGQANDILQQIRIALRHKSFLYRTEIRHNKSQSKKTRSWTRVGQVESTVQKNSRLYKQCHKALVRAEPGENVLRMYRDLTREDLKVSTGVVDDPGQRGTRQQKLCWFWTMNLDENAGDQETNDYLDD